MRMINIFPNDHELFDKDINSDDFVFYRSHIPTFKRMWNDQGSTFWLRFLVSFRKFMKTVNYEKLFIEKALGEFPMCSHNFFLCMDLGFIRIHKMFLEGDFSSAKSLVCDIFTLAQNLHLLSQLESTSLVYDPFYSTSTRDSFRNLFGLPRDKESLLKVAINYPLYLKFGGAVFQLLRRWLAENDIPEKDLPNVNNQSQYWVSYDIWLQKDFQVEYFESYIAKVWGEKLPTMLLASNIHNIFLREKVSLCNCNNKKNGFIKREVVEYCKSHSSCPNHKECRRKIIHNSKCEDPQFCRAENSTCILSCETEIKKTKLIEARKLQSCKSADKRSFWKHFEVYVEPCTQSKCRNVGTLVESYDRDIESYYLPKDAEIANAFQTFVDEISDTSIGMGMSVSAEVVNAVMQCRRVEAIKNRLRGKLSKKNRLRNIKLLEDPVYRLKMVEEASKKFRKDLEIEAQACGCNDWKAHEKDTCKNMSINSMKVIHTSRKVEVCKVSVHKQSESKGISCSSLDRANISVAVGTDERSGFGKVIQPQKKKPKMKKKNAKDLNPVEVKPTKKLVCSSDTLKTSIDPVAGGPELSSLATDVASEKIAHPTETVLIDEVSKNSTNSSIRDTENSENSTNNLKEESSDNKNTLKHAKPTVENACDPVPRDNEIVEKVEAKYNLAEIWNKVVLEYGEKELVMEKNFDHSYSTKNGEDSTDPVDRLLSVLTSGRNNNKVENLLPTILHYNTTKADETTSEKLENLSNGIKGEQAVTDVKPGKKSKLHVCVHCKQKETEPRTFKKCSRCKAENFPEPRYYCTRECQVDDWEESHRDEHLKRKMEK